MAGQMQEQFRQKMEHYFTKKYTEKDAEMRPGACQATHDWQAGVVQQCG